MSTKSLLNQEEVIEQVLPDIVPLAMPSVPANKTQVIPNTSEVTCARLFINGICIE